MAVGRTTVGTFLDLGYPVWGLLNLIINVFVSQLIVLKALALKLTIREAAKMCFWTYLSMHIAHNTLKPTNQEFFLLLHFLRFKFSSQCESTNI